MVDSGTNELYYALNIQQTIQFEYFLGHYF